MKSSLSYRDVGLSCLVVVFLTTFGWGEDVDKNWHRFRGPDGNGVAENAKPPIEWSGDSDNLKWKTEIPGKGSSSPIVWGDQGVPDDRGRHGQNS